MKHKFWFQYFISKNNKVNLFFEDFSKLNHFIHKHNIKDNQINFIKTRKELIK